MVQLPEMRGHEAAEKNTVSSERQRGNSIPGGRHYERQVCKRDALARQEREFARYDLNLSTKTMANWIIQCAGRYLQPLYDLMKEELLRSKYLHGDETRIQVLDEPDQKGSTQNWMWVYLTDEYSGSPRMVLFQYERTRAGYHPAEFLGDQFEGIFYLRRVPGIPQSSRRITVTGCMAHARRRFDEALTVLKKDFTKEQLKETTAYQQWNGSGCSIR